MILSGVPGVGKTTAIRALGRTVEQTYRARNPQMTRTVPVVYITMPTGQHPKALPAELLYFLGAPHAARATETMLTHQACQLMTDLRTSLVIVDEVHEIDRSRASHAQQSDQLKYFMDHVPATFVLAGINVENCGFFNGHRGEQLARRFTTLKASPSSYSTIRAAPGMGAAHRGLRAGTAPARPQARQPPPPRRLPLRPHRRLHRLPIPPDPRGRHHGHPQRHRAHRRGAPRLRRTRPRRHRGGRRPSARPPARPGNALKQ